MYLYQASVDLNLDKTILATTYAPNNVNVIDDFCILMPIYTLNLVEPDYCSFMQVIKALRTHSGLRRLVLVFMLFPLSL